MILNVILSVIIPLSLSLTLSPSLPLANTVLLLGMLKYAQGAKVIADVPQTAQCHGDDDDKKTN